MSLSYRIFIKTLWHSGAWIGIPIYVFLILIPRYYEYFVIVPDESELYHEKGDFIYKHSGSRMGYLMGVESHSGKKSYYTCSNGSGGRHDCILTDEFKSLKGQSVSLWWFWQPTYWGSKQQRVVRMNINGRDWVTRAETEMSIAQRRKSNVWFVLMYALLFLIVMWFIYRANSRSDHGPEAINQ